jgi:hypothetical protein
MTHIRKLHILCGIAFSIMTHQAAVGSDQTIQPICDPLAVDEILTVESAAAQLSGYQGDIEHLPQFVDAKIKQFINSMLFYAKIKHAGAPFVELIKKLLQAQQAETDIHTKQLLGAIVDRLQNFYDQNRYQRGVFFIPNCWSYNLEQI